MPTLDKLTYVRQAIKHTEFINVLQCSTDTVSALHISRSQSKYNLQTT